MRRLPRAAAVLLLWLAVLTFAFHGCGRLGCGSWARRRSSVSFVSFPRRMLIAVASLDASSTTTDEKAKNDHHHQQHHHHHRHSHHQYHTARLHSHWNWEGISPTAGHGEGVDPRYGVEKRLVPTGPNPLHH